MTIKQISYPVEVDQAAIDAHEKMVDETGGLSAMVGLSTTPPPRQACYHCGQRLYFSARKRGLGLCYLCEHGLDRRDPYRSIGANLRSVEWRYGG